MRLHTTTNQFSPSPTITLVLVFFTSVCIFLFCTSQALKYPWTHIEFICQNGVDKVAFEDQVKSISAISSPLHKIDFDEVVPDCISRFPATFEQLNSRAKFQNKLHILNGDDPITIDFDDGTSLTTPIIKNRTYADLSWKVWFSILFGVVFILIGCWIGLSKIEPMPKAALVILSFSFGFGQLLAIHLLVVRYFLVDGNHLSFLLILLSLFWKLVGCSLNALFSVYPNKLLHLKSFLGIYFFGFIFSLNEWFQVVDLPFNTYTFPYLLSFIYSITALFLQYRLSRNNLVNRTAVKLIFNTLVLSGLFIFFLQVLPVLLEKDPFLSDFHIVIIVGLTYIELLFGIFKYRLFDIDRWWFKIWFWFLGGILVVIIDLICIMFFRMDDRIGLFASLLIAGFIYFPLRQFILRKFNFNTEITFEKHFPKILETVFSDADYNDQWRTILTKTFVPLDCRLITRNTAEDIKSTTGPHSKQRGARIEKNGEQLIVPSLHEKQDFLLSFANGGKRLFNNSDIKASDMFFEVISQCSNLQNIQKASAQQERERIMSDLHDDVGGKLVTLVHRLKGQDRALARDTLKSVKEAIYVLDDSAQMSLQFVLINIQSNIRDTLRNHGIEFRWEDQDSLPQDVIFSARKRIDLSRIVTEAVTNAIKHAQPTFINITTSVCQRILQLNIVHNGAITHPDDWKSGKGLITMSNRAANIDSHLTYQAESSPVDQLTQLHLKIEVPF